MSCLFGAGRAALPCEFVQRLRKGMAGRRGGMPLPHPSSIRGTPCATVESSGRDGLGGGWEAVPGREQSPRSRLFMRRAAIRRRTCFAWILLSRCDAVIPVAAGVHAPPMSR